MTRDARQGLGLDDAVEWNLAAIAPVQDHAGIVDVEGARRLGRASKDFNHTVDGAGIVAHPGVLSRTVKFLQALTCYYFFAA